MPYHFSDYYLLTENVLKSYTECTFLSVDLSLTCEYTIYSFECLNQESTQGLLLTGTSAPMQYTRWRVPESANYFLAHPLPC